jgi:PAS domain S-box-containing protein
VGSPQPFALPESPTPRVNDSSEAQSSSASESENRPVRLWLLEPEGSTYAGRIRVASAEAGVHVAALEAIENAPANAALIGVGPSVPEPLQIARQLRVSGSQATLVVFTASSTARNALQADLLRDPFVYPRFEIIELPNNAHQLATRIGKVASELARRLHVRRTSRRGRSRTRTTGLTSSAAEPLLAQVLAQTRDAVLSTDETGRAITWNAAASRLLALSNQESRRRAPVALDRPEQHEVAELIQEVLSSGQQREARVTCPGPKGQPVQVLAYAAPIRDARGAQLGASLIVRDESEYERIQDALRESNRQKDEFLAIMSHELRTPLTSILGYTDMLMRGLSGPLGPMANKYVGNVRSAGDRLLELVNGLLDYTRLEAGVERLELKPVDLGRVVEQVVNVCRGAAQTKEVELSIAIPRDVDMTIEADEERVRHVFRSMLGNAVKFTPSGGWVKVLLAPEKGNLRVSVSDSGIGMRAEQIGRVWEQFYQGDASLTRPYGGMGLGLSIAKHLVDLHGGSVGAESGGPGLGSTFWFSLPRRDA